MRALEREMNEQIDEVFRDGFSTNEQPETKKVLACAQIIFRVYIKELESNRDAARKLRQS